MLLAFVFHSFSHLASLASLLAASADPFAQIKGLSDAVNTGVKIVGGAIFVVAVSVAGVMRMVAFGSERRIALSNMALTAAVVGLIIMAIGLGLSTFICNSLGTCK
jgi:xanthine/uracil permease